MEQNRKLYKALRANTLRASVMRAQGGFRRALGTRTCWWVERFLLMTSQISGPCSDSDINPDQCKSLVWETSHVRQQIFIVFEDVYR